MNWYNCTNFLRVRPKVQRHSFIPLEQKRPLRTVYKFNERNRVVWLDGKLMIDDINVRVTYLLTFNDKDFADVCRSRSVEML